MRNPTRPGTPTICLNLAALVAALAYGIALLWPRPTSLAQAAVAAPDFTLPSASAAQGSLTLRALRGHPILLNFFNSACPPCLHELPVLRQTARAYRAQGVVVLGVDTGGDSVETARRFVRAASLSYPVAVDAHQATAWQYGVNAWPASFFLDATGRVHAQYVGPLDAATVRNGLAQAGAISCTGCGNASQPDFATNAAAGTGSGLTGDTLYMPPRRAPAFALRDQRGQLVTPASLHGKVVALTFLSATCTEQCPLVGQALSRVDRLLGREAGRLAIVAISVDPEQDSPHAIRRFAIGAGWPGTDWHYLSGSRAVLSRIWAAYGVYVAAPPPTFKQGQSPVHQAGLFLLDPQGRLRVYDDVPFLASRVEAGVRALL